MTARRVLPISLLLVVGTLSSFAGGPVYSRYGFGDIVWFGSGRAAGLGGLGYGLRGEGFLNLANPAGLSGLRQTRFDGSFFYTSTTSEAGGASSPYSQAGLQSLSFGIPIDTARGITLLLSTNPYSQIGYAVTRRDEQRGVVSNQEFYGRGGLSELSLGLSYAPDRSFFAGFKASYLYGRVRQYTRIDFENASFTDDVIERSSFHSGFLLTLGVLWEPSSTTFGIRLPRDFSIGVALSLPTSTTVEQDAVFGVLDTVLTNHGTASVPLRFGLGTAFRFADRYVVAADVAMQDWSGSTYLGASVPDLRNSIRMSAGIEALPRLNDLSVFQRIAYRLGAGYHQTSVSVNGTGIDEMFVTGGVAVPIGPNARLNIALQYGVRGTTSNGLQRDSYLRLNVGLTGSELWFVNFEED